MSNMCKKNIYILIFLCLIGFICNNKQCYAATGESKQNYSRKIKLCLERQGINGEVLILNKDKKINIINNQSNQMKSEERVSYNNYFPIASLQKVLTGIATYELIKEGKIKLNTPINNYFYKTKKSHRITVKDLLSHRSGIQDATKLPNRVLFSEDQRFKFVENNFRVENNKDWHYSSSNYGLLAEIIKKKTGNTYYDYLNRKILVPSHLTNIKNFNDIININRITLPCEMYNNKVSKVESILQFVSYLRPIPFSFLSYSFSYYCFMRWLSGNFGAGDMLATPKSYWNFIYKYIFVNKNYINFCYKKSKQLSPHYFGGWYFNKDYVYAEGLTANYNACSFKANRDQKKLIMIFTNNTNYLQFKELKEKLYNIYFEK